MPEARWDVVVLGAGAAGLLAAGRAAELGCRTLLLEKNRKPGVKILMSGGTRCNLTHATDNRGIVEAFGPSGRFLYSALAALSVQETIEIFEAEGVATKVEPTGKIFPISNKAADVLNALLRRLRLSGATLSLAEPVIDLTRRNHGFRLITPQRTIDVPTIILTVGGQSYPGSGTTGDGYRFAAQLGHTIIPPRPALVPITVAEEWPRNLRGVTVPDVALRVLHGNATLTSRRGSMLFAHFGLSGPVVLDVSQAVAKHARPVSLHLEIDFVPAIREETLDDWLRTESSQSGKKQLAGILGEHVPRRLADELVKQAGMSVDRTAAALTRSDRIRSTVLLKRTRLAITGTLGFGKAEVTTGGIALDELDSRTMQSKLVPGLFIAGEVLDLDGPIGGYNFQAAFSTGWLAGQSAAARRDRID